MLNGKTALVTGSTSGIGAVMPNAKLPGQVVLVLQGGLQAKVGLDAASYYSTAPLRETLSQMVDLEILGKQVRLTVGAVKVKSGAMRYFDSRDAPLGLDEVMASAALPPGFPAIRVGGEAHWDGGLFRGRVAAQRPRTESIWQVMARQKDIQYASRADSHIARWSARRGRRLWIPWRA